MLVKSKSRKKKTFRQLIGYIRKGMDEHSISVQHNVRGTTTKELTKAFLFNESQRLIDRHDSVRCYHEILSLSPEDKDKLTPEVLEDLTRKYVELRADRGIVYAGSHQDREHTHVHLAISGTEYMTGRSMRISKEEFARCKKELSSYMQEKYPELQASIVEHGSGKKQENDREVQLKRRTGKPSKKDQIKERIAKLHDCASNLDGFLRSLGKAGYEVYERGGKPYGVVVDGRKYRFTTLDLDKEKLQELDRTDERLQRMKQVRGKGRENRSQGNMERMRDLREDLGNNNEHGF